MEYFWLIILAFIIFRAIGGRPGRYEPCGKYKVPRENLPYKEEEMPYSYSEEELLPESSPADKPVEIRQELNMPLVPAGRGGELTNVSSDSRYEGRRGGPAGERRPDRGKKIGFRQEHHGICSGEGLFEGGISQRELMKGMVWSQILGPRGGIQANRRSRYSPKPF